MIDKIQERGYVKKDNIEGKKLEIIDYTLEDGIIKEDKGEKVFGNEKNKLQITQIGIFVIEFLLNYFDELFEYDYTKKMEDTLDLIAKGEKKYHELCRECDDFITNLMSIKSLESKNDKVVEKINIKIDDKHTYLIGKNGPTIKYTKEDGTVGFYGVKDNIDIEKLKNGEYELEDIIHTKEDNNKIIGEYKNKPVYLKFGKFGYYLNWNDVNKSLKGVKINVPTKNIGIEDAISILQNSESGQNSLVRRIDENLSIRKGKFGDYIFYKTEKMKRPQFLKLNGFDNDYRNCSIEDIQLWIKERYQI